MNYEYIEQLLDRYFLAETSLEEEQILQAFFRQEAVPEHLQVYAHLFAYVETQQEVGLGADFDTRVMARLQEEGQAVLHVKVKRMTLGERLKPLWRAAAAVAIVVVLGGGVRQATRIGNNPAVIGVTSGQAYNIQQTQRMDPAAQPYRKAIESQKMAVTAGDSAAAEKLAS